MSVIDFTAADCSNCYKCVRECPVKAIKVKDEQATIVEELCIGCGQCLRVCPKNAKEVKSELDIVKHYIECGYKVIVSLAPSFAAAFKFKQHGQVVSALKKLGFYKVEETSVAASIVSEQYNKYYAKDDNDNYITTSCASVNYLIQKYYPKLIGNMMNVKSPMVLHGTMIKKKYGEDTKVVFIGPCLSKKMEALETKFIDSVLTFDEINKWLETEHIDVLEMQDIPFDSKGKAARLYPVLGGISVTLNKSGAKSVFNVDGIEKGQIKNTWIEMSLCSNSCINGPAMPEDNVNVYVRKHMLQNYAKKCEKINQICQNDDTEETGISDNDLNMLFKDKSKSLKIPTHEEIKKILASIGKATPSDELNCGACGYNTCRDKAIAVYNGMAEKNMCVPYMRKRAETLSNLIFDVTPNIVFMLNSELDIVTINPAAESYFNVKRDFAEGKPVSMLIDDKDFLEVSRNKKPILSKRLSLKEYKLELIETIIYLESHDIMLVIMMDITDSEKKEEEIKKMKMQTIDMAQKVIDKQMTVAQEIASLLGETTAETKVTLTKLKKLVQEGEGADIL